MKTITIFTPTYNREHTLPQLYESLCRQTCMDFVWSIVDDGSKDNTEGLVREWKNNNRIAIEYQKQPNGGKMRAHNLGARLCSTPLFVCIDSDDYVCDNFVESVKTYKEQLEADERLAGIIAYRGFPTEDKGFVPKRKFPLHGTGTLSELYQNGFVGDTTLVFKTGVIKQYPFLEIDGEKFSTEAYAYNQIEQEYQFLIAEEIWTLCTYMPDGYTQGEKALYVKNPKGWALFFNQRAKFTHSYISKKKIAYGVLYMIFARRAGIKDIYKQSELKTPLYPLFWLLSYFYEWKWREKYPR